MGSGFNVTSRVGIVILNWNGSRDTIACIESILPDVRAGLARVIVVDNASTDGSVDRIRDWMNVALAGIANVVQSATDPQSVLVTEPPAITLVESDRNGGYAAGNNIGLRMLLNDPRCEYCWILNNDTLVLAGTIAALLEFGLRYPEKGIVGCTIVDYYDRDTIQYAGGARYNVLLSLNKPAFAGRSYAEISDLPDPCLDFVCGAAMFVRSETLRKVGLLNEKYFLYYEEIDLAKRAERLDCELGWCRAAVIYHKEGASTGGQRKGSRRRSELAEYHANRSCILYTAQFHPALVPVTAMVRLLGKIVIFAIRREWHLFRPLASAYLDTLRSYCV